jgi:transcriptional regulator with XRE-family HTH domain
VKDLKNAGRDQEKVAELMGSNPAHVIGIEIKNSFNGTWGTDAKWHKIFYKDIKAHEMFTGKFEAEKTIKFHENPVPEKVRAPCDGIDC